MRLLSRATIGIIMLMAACGHPLTLTKDNVEDILRAMTPEEKARLVVGAGNETFTGYGNTMRLVPGAAGTTAAIKRLGITPAVLTDGPAGLRIDTLRKGDTRRYYHTGFPIATALGCTWNTDLLHEVGEAIGQEAREYGIDLLLAPGMNLHRDPLGGRNFEYYAEDPLLSGCMAAAFVNGIQRQSVGATLKHFAVNNQETNRKDIDVRIGQRALRELYLRAFEIAVRQASPAAVMSAYNMINGQQCMESHDLLTKILRADWKYRGFVLCDWAAPGWRDTAKEIQAGNDLLTPGSEAQQKDILRALDNGALTMTELDACARRVLRFVTQTTRFNRYPYSDNPPLHAATSRKAAEEGIVLLENNRHALPLLADIKRVALFGVSAYNFISVGTGSGNVKTPHTVNLLEGLRNVGIQANPTLSECYKKIISDTIKSRQYDPLGYAAISETAIGNDNITAAATNDDAAIVTIGRSCGEGADRLESTDYNLSATEKNLLSRVCTTFHAQGKPVVVVLNVSGVVEIESWKSLPDAILLAWLPGQEGGDAVCRVLTGAVCPSGKLTMTFPIKYSDCSTYGNFPADYHGPKAIGNYPKIPRKPAIKNVHYVDYDEGIYVGYRYFDTYDKPVSYPFGYGKSYTTFAYGPATLHALDNDSYEIHLNITNTGNIAGKEVVQAYAPVKGLRHQLIAFAKTKTLVPGQSETVKLRFGARDLSWFNPQTNAWQLDQGDYTIALSANARDARRHLRLTIPATRTIETVTPALLPQH